MRSIAISNKQTERPDPGRLLSWYDANRRSFPWRQDNDPYRVLVSEIMLQQTRTEVVRERFPEFLARFPDLETLAVADEDEVLAAWSGLGYYRRARFLHATAQAIVERGAWPPTAEELEQLPGVGDYTAAALASIAFGEPVVVVDGNVKRLAARLGAEDGDPSRRAVVERLRSIAGGWLDPQRPGDSNQALMELGATVCKRQPRCHVCPLTGTCRAFASGDPDRWPKGVKKPAMIDLRWRLALIRCDARVWLVRRGDDAGWLPGIYELPWVDDAEGDQGSVAEDRFRRKYGMAIRFGDPVAVVRHAIGRRSIHARVWTASLVTPESAVSEPSARGEAASGGRWVTADELPSLATGSLVDKAMSAAEE